MRNILPPEGETEIPYSDEIARLLEASADKAGGTAYDIIQAPTVYYSSQVEELNQSARRQGGYRTRGPRAQSLLYVIEGDEAFIPDKHLHKLEEEREARNVRKDFTGLNASIYALNEYLRRIKELPISEVDLQVMSNTALGHLSIAWWLFAKEPGIENEVREVRLINAHDTSIEMLENSIRIADLSNYPAALRHLSRTANYWEQALGSALEGYYDAQCLGRADLPWFADGVGRVLRNLNQAKQLNKWSKATFSTTLMVARDAVIIPASNNKMALARSAVRKYLQFSGQ